MSDPEHNPRLKIITFYTDKPVDAFHKLRELVGRRVFVTEMKGHEVTQTKFPYTKAWVITIRYLDVPEGLLVCDNIRDIIITGVN